MRKTSALAVALAVMLALLCGVLTISKKASAQVSDPGGAPSSTQNIDPTFVSGNTSCTALGYAYGYKIDNAPFYRTNVGDGAIRVTTTGSGGKYFDWTSNIGVDAMIVKGGPNSDAFVYDPGKGEVTLDTGLHAPTNPNGSGPFGISHIEFCYDLELKAAKTAEGSYDRTISWALQKNVDPASHSGQAGQDAGSSEWTVTATKSEDKSNYQVTGNIIITNPNTVSVGFDVSDVLDDGTAASVDCDPNVAGNQSSGTVAAESSVTCTYTASPEDANATKNTATVTSNNPKISGAAAQANIGWTAKVIGDEKVTLADEHFDKFSKLINDTTTETFPETFACSTNPADYPNGSRTDTYTNTATLKGGNTNESASAEVKVTCTPSPNSTLEVVKFYDANVNGTNDAGEQLIEGWKVSVAGPNGYGKEGLTTLNLLNLAFGGYTATEANSTAGTWIKTTPKSASVELTQANPDGSIEFGNVCLGAGGGHTLGSWSNKNGQAQMNDGGTMEPELNMLKALNLKNPDNTDFDPTTYAQFRTWLLNGNAVNMNNMLSVQLAAMKLNVEAGFVDPTQLVYAPGVTSTSDYVSIGFLMDKANTALATTAGGRAYKEVLKNALDGANNNTNFVQRHICNFRF